MIIEIEKHEKEIDSLIIRLKAYMIIAAKISEEKKKKAESEEGELDIGP